MPQQLVSMIISGTDYTRYNFSTASVTCPVYPQPYSNKTKRHVQNVFCDCLEANNSNDSSAISVSNCPKERAIIQARVTVLWCRLIPAKHLEKTANCCSVVQTSCLVSSPASSVVPCHSHKYQYFFKESITIRRKIQEHNGQDWEGFFVHWPWGSCHSSP